jgi:hypothetical protein
MLNTPGVCPALSSLLPSSARVLSVGLALTQGGALAMVGLPSLRASSLPAGCNPGLAARSAVCPGTHAYIAKRRTQGKTDNHVRRLGVRVSPGAQTNFLLRIWSATMPQSKIEPGKADGSLCDDDYELPDIVDCAHHGAAACSLCRTLDTRCEQVCQRTGTQPVLLTHVGV